jgi:tetratricopeptide (TPR) repeat protein
MLPPHDIDEVRPQGIPIADGLIVRFLERSDGKLAHVKSSFVHVVSWALKWFPSCVLALALIQAEYGHACTIAVSTDGKTVIAGNNEDYADPRTGLWFIPAENGSFGKVLWGYDRYSDPYQGGMNDQGLFIDLNAISGTGWKSSPDRPDFAGDVFEHVLSHFSSLEEVVRFFESHDIDLGWVKYFVADAYGESAIIEWLDGGLNIIRRDRPFQISTNYQSPLEPTEPRYQIAEKILSQPGGPSVKQMRRVLSATAYDVNEIGQTLYSTICDLKQKTLYVYHFHNFEEVVTFDLADELKKGRTQYRIPDLFEIRPHYELWFNISGLEVGAGDLADLVENHGIEAAIQRFPSLRDDTRTYKKYLFEEWALQGLALRYRASGRTAEAVAIFRLTAETFPDSWEAHRNLADAYLGDGDKVSAIASYERALELNPSDSTVSEALKELRAEPVR